MNIEWIGGVPSSNFRVGREGNPVSLIVDHWSVVSFDDTVAAFQRNGVARSSHFVVSQTGKIAQLVSTDDTAYHAGVWNVNLRSLGIEHEASPTLPPSNAQYAASAWLHSQLARIHSLSLEVGLTVKPHRAIVPTQCPGTLDLDHIVALAGLEEDMTPEEAKQISEKAIADAGLDPNTVAVIKHKLDGHIHVLVPNANQTTAPLFPPVAGALYGGSSADFSQVFWDYPDGTRHNWVNGKEV